MPTLDPDDEARIVREMPWECPKCHRPLARRYCSRCDEIYFLCNCPIEKREDHRDHAAGPRGSWTDKPSQIKAAQR